MAGKTDGSASASRSKHHRRTPLGDGQSTVNRAANAPKKDMKEGSPSKLEKAVPKNESLVGNGTYAVRHTISSPKNNRVSQISESASENKRNSAISTTSTNASGTGRKRKTHIGPWQLGATVGKGGTARVRKVKHSVTGQMGVAKIIPVAVAERARAISLANLVRSAEDGDPTLDFGKQIPLGLEREIAIMKLLKHPNIVKLYDVWENRNEIYLIMEFVEGGELFEYVAERTRLQEDVTVYLFRQIVWALKYCHGLNIHHRDLKPENILLDYEHMTVKLVDFGMAALQPEGNFLTTPCGSPHYAAPELLCNRPYDGSQADVWSAGVVLFVMLTGYPPFNFPPDSSGIMPEDHKLKGLFRAITRADYRMPGALSLEAQDLIRRIFIPDPRKRINIDQVWDHPFIHKYDAVWGLDTLQPSDSMIQLALAQDDWKPLRPKSIDREIFRALRTLWHSESDTALTDKLCNGDFNQEKYFYHTMLRYREENLETIQSSQNSFGYSASDYQHSKSAPPVPPIPTNTPTQTTPASKRHSAQSTTSKFSITGDEHLMSKHSYYDLPVSEASYDPFRASRSPLVPKLDFTTTVHRLDSRGAKKRISRVSRGSSLRVDVLRGHSRRVSHVSSKHSSGSTSVRRGKRSSKSSSSRLSTASSYLLNGSPMPVMRPSELHKRGVQFSHARRSSTGSALSSGDAKTPDHRARALRKLASRRSSSFLTASPAMPVEPIVIRKKGAAVQPTPGTKKLTERADLEARKVSAELGKVCDEAFWRSSMSDSFQTTSLSSAERPFADTPPSSVSRPSPHFGLRDPFYMSESMRNRPLPPTPMGTKSTLYPQETPVTYTARELADMRDRLAAKYAREGAGNQKYFNDVLTQLDNLMKPIEEQDETTDSRRIVSAPPDCHYLRASVDLNPLHSIPEEGRPLEEVYGQKQNSRLPQISRTARRGNGVDQGQDGTIRVVQPSPPTNTFGIKPQHLHLVPPRDLTSSPFTPQPLKIRKTSSSTNSESIGSSEDEMEKVKKLAHSASQKLQGDLNLPLGITVSRHSRSGAADTSAGPDSRIYSPDAIPALAMGMSRIPSPPTIVNIGSSNKRSSKHLDLNSPDRRGITSHPQSSDSSWSAGIRPTIESAYMEPVHEEPGHRMTSIQHRLSRADAQAAVQDDIEQDATVGASRYDHGDVRWDELDDRPHTRDQRADGTPRHERRGFSKFVKKMIKIGTKNKDANASDNFILPPPTNLPVIKAYQSYDGQKDIKGQHEAANFLRGWTAWMRKKTYVPKLMAPAHVVLASNESRSHVLGRMSTMLFLEKGWKATRDPERKFTYTLEITAKDIEQLQHENVKVIVEFFPVSVEGRSASLCLIRLVQCAGPLGRLQQLGDWLQAWLQKQDLHVRDLSEAAEMKAALYRGLLPADELRRSRDSYVR